jgi:signal transduction histidine kinase
MPEQEAPQHRPPLVRHHEGRVVAGVASGIADHLHVHVRWVRLIFTVLVTSGVGVLAYLAFWLLVPSDSGEPALDLRAPRELVSTILGALPHDRRRQRILVIDLLIGISISSALGFSGLGFGSRSLLPLSVGGIGALLIWWRAPAAQREQWTSDARRVGSRIGGQRTGPILIIAGGVGLVIVGVASFLAANHALTEARDGALAIGATVVGVLLVTGPWLFRLLRELARERRARIRAQERAEVAAHVHDSVLQTLALLQSQAEDPDNVRRLARRQERELREWLYPASDNAAETFAVALRRAAADVEDAHGIGVEVVVVGDAPLDDALSATVAAAREGLVNAAKSSGAPSVSLFAEVNGSKVEVFVRDRGQGFDVDAIPHDRKGIRESIIGRMTRHGGKADIRSGPDGTEVALSVQRQATT